MSQTSVTEESGEHVIIWSSVIGDCKKDGQGAVFFFSFILGSAESDNHRKDEANYIHGSG